ncbi:FecR domain-containing protein [Pseudomonas schmalbachii]|uniref:FecR domain-containing protein n=1 Tax=Pseudomonas schmalbachii TaxID=2816993 RepID=A0ABS3TKT7_9PSED|nr:FecR domain-containing protein [Pseudomonas schmalbachii]MBO3274252.1 FecR domain-containing protein [Pseudomonas schmalbachii]
MAQRDDIDPAILDEVADWLVLLQSGEAGDADLAALTLWRGQSPAHEEAWRRAETILGAFRQVPPAIGRTTLQRLGKPGRRQVLRTLGLLLATAPAAWLAWRQMPWREWTADIRTGTGEQKAIDLADGTRLVLNTASAVDVVFSAGERRLLLRAGEILVTTGRDPSPAYRPFIVQTVHGSLRALGTRFTVRSDADSTHVAVFEGAVAVQPLAAGDAAIVRAGERMTFSASRTQAVQPVDASAALWEQGMLVAKDMRLGDLLRELGRYRTGILRCDPAVADMPVSGAFPLRDTRASLALLEKTLPLHISSTTSWWVAVEAR